MIHFFHSFYARLSVIFLFLILSLVAGSLFITFNFTRHLIDEVEQLLNLGYAESMATEIKPLVADGFNLEKIKSAIHYMMVLNPMVEIYLLDGNGAILAYFIFPDENIKRENIDLNPVREFIKEGGNRLILGDDPRHSHVKKPFSAAPLDIGSDKGYLYIILRGQSFDYHFTALGKSYYLRSTFISFLFALGATLIVGFSLFFFLTRRLRLLGTSVKNFKKGQLYHRTAVTGKDEIGVLGSVFNEMAETIELSLKKLKDSEKMRRELIANISHDLRSPLTSIRGYVETILMKDTQLSVDKRKKFLEIILLNIDGFQRLVEELFELVRLETGQVEPCFEPLQLLDLAQDVMLQFKPRSEAEGITLDIDALMDIPLVSADVGMIERVLHNLIDNAIKFTPAKGKVTIALSSQQNDVEIAVIDTGSGITKDKLPHIFERYYHGKKSKSGGTGLGLAIAKQIVEIHGSTLRVESIPGKGSRFSFHLGISTSS